MSVCKLWKELVQKVISEHLNLMHKECWKFGFRFEIKESSFEYNTFSTSFKYTPPIIEYEFSNESSTIIFDPDNELFPRQYTLLLLSSQLSKKKNISTIEYHNLDAYNLLLNT
ncbi:9545_t:CDS:2 [Entrophospora sp. SA101]|nr:9545_t:CDS:2 [Entrophospora sp. SA101]